jgi:hypothetical protein
MAVIIWRVHTMRKSVMEIIDTIKALKGSTKNSEVVDSLGLGRGALSNAKKRDSLSFFVFAVALTFQVSDITKITLRK